VENERLKAQILYKLGRPQDAIEVLRPMHRCENLEKIKEEYLNVTNLLGVCYMTIGEFDKALGYYFETSEAASKMNDMEYVAISLKNIGITYYKLKDYGKALPFMLKSYSTEQLLNIRNVATPMNISLCYTNLGDYENARLLLRESISICGMIAV
jgi:tetratricopeptide (TPR) repeat protein